MEGFTGVYRPAIEHISYLTYRIAFICLLHLHEDMPRVRMTSFGPDDVPHLQASYDYGKIESFKLSINIQNGVEGLRTPGGSVQLAL